MSIDRRSALLTVLAWPAGCAIQRLGPLPTQPIAPPAGAVALRAPQPGQGWTYRQLNRFNSVVLDEVDDSVASSGDAVVVQRRSARGLALADERHARWGQLWRDPAWDAPMTFESPVPLWPAELQPGRASTVYTHYLLDGGSFRYAIQVHSVVHGWERVTVSAGTFDTLRIERFIRLDHPDPTRLATSRRDTLWVSMAVGRWVARETSGRYLMPGDGWWRQIEALEDQFRWELTAWR